MRKVLALATCMVTVAAACGSSDGDSGGPVSTEATPVTEAPPTETEPAPTEPADTQPPAEEPAPEPTTAPEPEPEPEITTTTEPPTPLNVVGLAPLPGAQLDFSAVSVDVPTLVWSVYSGSGGVIVESVGGPIPDGCHGTSFFNPETFELLQIDGVDLHAYATRGEGGCDGMQQDLEDGVIDGDAVKVNDGHLIQFDFGSLPLPPFDVSTQVVNPGGADGIFRNAEPFEEIPVNVLEGASHAVGASGVFEVDPDDRTLTWLDLPAAAPGPGCEGSAALCLGDRFGIEIVNAEGSPASAITSDETGGRFYFFGNHDVNILVSVLNGCSLNNGFWVFAAATTDVEFDLTVTDTMTGATKSYSNQLGAGPGPVLDTEAFATCP